MSRNTVPLSMNLRHQRNKLSEGSLPMSPALTSLKESMGMLNSLEPSTPTQNGIAHLKKRLEDHLEGRENIVNEDKTSPGLAMLRSTPAKMLKSKQDILIRKHEEARQKADQLSVGGGVALWPHMENMKLGKGEIMQLIITSLGLAMSVFFIFWKLHGSSVKDLQTYTSRLKSFSRSNTINILSGQENFQTSLLSWHTGYQQLLSSIHTRFDMKSSSIIDSAFLLCYLAGVGTLMYYLIDNMFAKSKLSPRRTKTWVCLLSVVGMWTLLMMYWLILAHHLEYAAENHILRLADILGDLVQTDIDLRTFHSMLTYWQTRSLPPTTHGLLSILGLLPVRDVMYYLQYFSLPIITVLVTPIVRLIIALYGVYRVPV